jgi:6-phosphogluconate dehydrogenase (decarboxylating)
MSMKVGIIGLGRIGEGMARRMLEKGIEVWGYSSTNYESACGQYEAGYISGCVTSLEYLVQAVKSDSCRYTSAGRIPGIFQITLPEEKVDDILDELLPLLEEGDIIIDHSNRDITKCQELEKYCSKLGISYIFSGVYGAPYAIDACSKIFQSLSPGNVK